MISAFTNIFKIPELRQRILFTVAMLVIVRAGAAITIPGVNAHVLNEWFQTSMAKSAGGGVAALFNIFAGGALEHCAIFSLGIMPYISASIMMQLLTAVIPRLNKLAREDGGRVPGGRAGLAVEIVRRARRRPGNAPPGGGGDGC